MGNDAKVSAVVVGDLELSFDSNIILILKNCYITGIRKNIVSVSSLVRFGFCFFNDSMVISHNKYFIYSDSLVAIFILLIMFLSVTIN